MRAGAEEFARFHRVQPLDVDVLHAHFVTHAYARHSHETLVIGVFEKGRVRYRYHGGIERCGPQLLMVFDPDEPHDGIPEAGGFLKRVVYVPTDLVRRTLGTVGAFGRSTLEDHELFVRWLGWLEQVSSAVEPLAVETEFTQLLDVTFGRWSAVRRAETENRAGLLRARERLQDEFDRNLSLEELSRTAALSRAEFVRQFSAAFGLPPHAYQVNVRLQKARRMLASGSTLSEVALAAGFCDQAHLSRRFSKAYGVPPGEYAKTARSYKTGIAATS
jgi:AraC-like DNA-binding protein